MNERGKEKESSGWETSQKSTRRRSVDAEKTKERGPGDKLKNEESRRKHYRSKIRYGKEDNSLSVKEKKTLDQKVKRNRKQVRAEAAKAEGMRRQARSMMDSQGEHEDDNSSARDIRNQAENLVYGTVEDVQQKAKNSHYSRKLHERAKKKSEQIETAKKGSNELSKELQKRRIKQETMNAAKRKAEKEAANSFGSFSKKFVDKAEDLAGRLAERISEKLMEIVTEHPLMAISVVAIGLILLVIMGSLSSCSLMGGGVSNTTIATSYTAKDQTIRDVENDYKEKETDLQEEIDDIETDYPGYDEYRYDLSEIGHNAHHLAALLTVLYEDYSRSEVQAKLTEIFNKQYKLTTTEVVETRTRTETRTGYNIVENDDGTFSVESYEYEVEVEYDYYILKVKLTNTSIDTIVSGLGLTTDQMQRYELLKVTYGNKQGVFGDDVYSEANPGDYQDYDIPPEALTDQKFANMVQVGERYLGYPYVWGGSSPSTSFDCSGFVSYVINNCGNGWNVGRQTANGLLGKCTRVSSSEAKPGDLIFFQGTYATSGASHVGIYVGNGMMLHCGNPIQYASINTTYWQNHFYTFGRIN